MDTCRDNRMQIAEEFKKYQKVFVAQARAAGWLLFLYGYFYLLSLIGSTRYRIFLPCSCA